MVLRRFQPQFYDPTPGQRARSKLDRLAALRYRQNVIGREYRDLPRDIRKEMRTRFKAERAKNSRLAWNDWIVAEMEHFRS